MDPTRSQRILVVDASGVQRSFVCGQLHHLGYETLEAASGAEACAAVESATPPDAVLMGWEVPGLSGPELIRRWQADPELRWIPVLMVTSHLDPGRIQEAMACGAVDFLRKPWEPIELEARLRSALRIHDLQSQLRDLADRDPLTGLPNRRVCMERLEREFTRAQRYERDLAVAMLDIDFFKRINDAHGHDVGDLVLRQVADFMSDRIRSLDLVARIGGEEFVMLMPETLASGARTGLERVRRGMEMYKWGPDPAPFPVTLSIGYAVLPDVACDEAADLLKAADEALYRAKQSGRNRCVAADDL